MFANFMVECLPYAFLPLKIMSSNGHPKPIISKISIYYSILPM
jgi:hypothetical protein